MAPGPCLGYLTLPLLLPYYHVLPENVRLTVFKPLFININVITLSGTIPSPCNIILS